MAAETEKNKIKFVQVFGSAFGFGSVWEYICESTHRFQGFLFFPFGFGVYVK